MWQITSRPTFTRREKIAAGLIIFLAVLVLALPSLVGFWRVSSDQVFFGSIFTAPADYPVYLSQIEQARSGRWLMENSYTLEPQNLVMFSPLWLFLGWLAKLTTLSGPLIFFLAKILMAGIFLSFLYFFLSNFFVLAKERLVIFFLAIFSSGLGAWVLPQEKVWDIYTIFYRLPTDFWVAESNTFLSLYHSALFSLSQLLILLIFYFFLKPFSRQNFLILGLVSLFLGILHPYDLVIVGFVPGLYLLLITILEYRVPWEKIKSYLAILLFALPAGFYYLWLVGAEPVMRRWAEQNITLSPPVSSFIIGYGLVLVLAILGGLLVIKNREQKFYFFLVWVIGSAILLSIPSNLQRRFVNGLHLALVILAGEFLLYFWPQIKNRLVANLLLPIFLILVSLSNIAIITQDTLNYYRRDNLRLISSDYQNAMEWLKNNTAPAATILADVQIANIIPGLTARRVYAGHGHQTVDFWIKKAKVGDWFFRINYDDSAKAEFLQNNGIDYLWFSSYEKAWGNFNPGEKFYLKPVFSNSQVTIYQALNKENSFDED